MFLVIFGKVIHVSEETPFVKIPSQVPPQKRERPGDVIDKKIRLASFVPFRSRARAELQVNSPFPSRTFAELLRQIVLIRFFCRLLDRAQA